MKVRSFAAAAAAGAAFAGVAHAADTEVFDFKGQCTSSSCNDFGTGKLVLTGYTPGTVLQTTNFVSFTYNSSSFLSPIVIGGAGDTYNSNLTGNIGATPGHYDVGFSGTYLSGKGVDTFSSAKANPGNWSFTGQFLISMPTANSGVDGVWAFEGASAAPEPETWALMAAGAMAIGGALRASRRRRLPLAA